MKKQYLENSMGHLPLSSLRIGIFAQFTNGNKSSSSFPSANNKSRIPWPFLFGFLVFMVGSYAMNAQACEAPSNLQIEYENEMPTAQVSWDGGTPENGWVLIFGLEGSINIDDFISDPDNYENPEAKIEYISESPHFVYMNMLQPGLYDVYVVADCGGEGMVASELLNFTKEENAEEIIDPNCETPYNMTVVDSGEAAVDVSWEPEDGELYHIAWGPMGLEMNEDFFNDPQTGSVIVSENPFHLIFTGPERFETRSLYIRKFCGDNNFSEWTEPICEEPSDLDSSQEEEDINLTWTPGASENGWEVAYGPEGFDVNDQGNPDVTRVNTYATPTYTISVYDVELGNTYDFYVRSRCSEQNFSDWTGPSTFIPELAPCFAVSATEARHVTYATADIYWTPVGGESSWTVTYGVSPLDPDNAITLPAEGNPKLTLTDLDATTQYDVYITAVCTAGQTADGEAISFTTTEGSTGGYCTPVFQHGCEYDIVIDHFILTGENDTQIYDLNTGCSDSNYNDKTDISVELAPGSDYLAWVTSGSLSGDHCVIWIDLNNDGVFEESERVAAKAMDSPSEIVLLNIPANASAGERRMRVLVGMASYPENLTPCNESGDTNGEVHDYTVIIRELENCSSAIAGVPMDNFEICPDQSFTIAVSAASAPAIAM
ncbi:MAG TPA: GEVED domain-containing protein, partial [Fermentimonas sp.]|nr:GEVED domain-containing protein [Fermentimonas sp.]